MIREVRADFLRALRLPESQGTSQIEMGSGGGSPGTVSRRSPLATLLEDPWRRHWREPQLIIDSDSYQASGQEFDTNYLREPSQQLPEVV